MTPEEKMYLDWADACNREAEKQWLKEHDNEIRKDEREKVIEEIIVGLNKWVESFCWHQTESYPYKHKTPRKKALLEKFKSLREIV